MRSDPQHRHLLMVRPAGTLLILPLLAELAIAMPWLCLPSDMPECIMQAAELLLPTICAPFSALMLLTLLQSCVHMEWQRAYGVAACIWSGSDVPLQSAPMVLSAKLTKHERASCTCKEFRSAQSCS